MDKQTIITLLQQYYPQAVAYICDAYDSELEEMNIACLATLLGGELNKIKNPDTKPMGFLMDEEQRDTYEKIHNKVTSR